LPCEMSTASTRSPHSSQMESLAEISKRYQTDKSEHLHYLANYERYLGPLRDRPVKLFELGIKDGGSLLMWRDYLPLGTIAGLDIAPVEIQDNSGRIHTYAGQQQDTGLLDRIAGDVAPDGFDAIIDDCSHIATPSRVSFHHLFANHLKSGGLYIIEDWGCGYWDHWADGSRYRARPLRTGPGIGEWVGYKLTSLLRSAPDGVLANALSHLKRPFTTSGSTSHRSGMVGLIKELVDNCAIEDIKTGRGNVPGLSNSLIKEIVITASHAFVIKV
jgi:hypothetical protein